MSDRDKLTAEVAQGVADRINPPFFQLRTKNLPAKERRDLPVEDLFERVWVRKGPDDQPYVTFKAEDQQNSFRAATYRELAAAFLDHLHPVIETAEELGGLPGKVVLVDDAGEIWRLTNEKADNLETNGEHLYPRSCIKLPATVLHRGES